MGVEYIACWEHVEIYSSTFLHRCSLQLLI